MPRGIANHWRGEGDWMFRREGIQYQAGWERRNPSGRVVVPKANPTQLTAANHGALKDQIVKR